MFMKLWIKRIELKIRDLYTISLCFYTHAHGLIYQNSRKKSTESILVIRNQSTNVD